MHFSRCRVGSSQCCNSCIRRWMSPLLLWKNCRLHNLCRGRCPSSSCTGLQHNSCIRPHPVRCSRRCKCTSLSECSSRGSLNWKDMHHSRLNVRLVQNTCPLNNLCRRRCPSTSCTRLPHNLCMSHRPAQWSRGCTCSPSEPHCRQASASSQDMHRNHHHVRLL
jgi:hypothetical protein